MEGRGSVATPAPEAPIPARWEGSPQRSGTQGGVPFRGGTRLERRRGEGAPAVADEHAGAII
jgi:hypothetical protein